MSKVLVKFSDEESGKCKGSFPMQVNFASSCAGRQAGIRVQVAVDVAILVSGVEASVPVPIA